MNLSEGTQKRHHRWMKRGNWAGDRVERSRGMAIRCGRKGG